MADVRFENIDLPNGKGYRVRFDGSLPTAVWVKTTTRRGIRMIWHNGRKQLAGPDARAAIAKAKP